MPSINRALKFLLHDRMQFLDYCVKNLGLIFPDKLYLQLRFRFNMGYWPNLQNPITFNEKLNWLKLYNRKADYTMMVDKYAVKAFVKEKIGSDYIIPTIGVWSSSDMIDWDILPNQFVLKTTHGGGGCGIVVCTDKSKLNKTEAISKLNRSMKIDIYAELREWPYKNVKKKIIAEKFMTPRISSAPDSYGGLKDYKFFCFNGKVKCFKVDYNRFVGHRANYYSPDGNLLPFGEMSFLPNYNHMEILPENLNEMIAIAEKLSKGHPFLRIDLYNINGKIYFGEITCFPASGFGKFTNNEWDIKLGQYLKLPMNY